MQPSRIRSTSTHSRNPLDAARKALVGVTAAVAIVSLSGLVLSVCDNALANHGRDMQETTLGSSYRTAGIAP